MIFGRKKLMEWAANGGVSPFDVCSLGNRNNECCLDISIGAIVVNGVASKLSQHYLLLPGQTQNFLTIEKITMPIDAMGFVTVRSVWAQRKLNHLTSQIIKPGWKSEHSPVGGLVLELQNVGNVPIELAYGDAVCQITLQEVSID